jgi:hypothetical protein
LTSPTHSHPNAERQLKPRADKSDPSRHRPYASLKVNAQGGEHGSSQQATSLSRENIVELLLDKNTEAQRARWVRTGWRARQCITGDIIWAMAGRSCNSSSRAPTLTCKVHIMVMHYKQYQQKSHEKAVQLLLDTMVNARR